MVVGGGRGVDGGCVGLLPQYVSRSRRPPQNEEAIATMREPARLKTQGWN